jgi:hypothetical protein
MKRISDFYQFVNENLISVGNTGDIVSQIQTKLIDLGLLNQEEPDGIFGKNTKKAVEKFQIKNKLNSIDGIVGPETAQALKLSLGSDLPSSDSANKRALTPVVKYKQAIVSDSLKNDNIVLDPTKETKPFKVKEEGCSQWVASKLMDHGVPRQGHAWFARIINEKMLKFNAFKNFSPTILNDLAKIFSQINSNPVEKAAESQVHNLVKKIIPNQAPLKSMLKVNDIVGLYYNGSHNFTKAFFESGCGRVDMGAGEQVTQPYFRRKSDNEKWTPEDLKKKIEFIPGNTLKDGGGFTFNTHLGYVGAIVDGEPIIFHNIDKTLHSTPFSKMGNIKILWIKSTVISGKSYEDESISGDAAQAGTGGVLGKLRKFREYFN